MIKKPLRISDFLDCAMKAQGLDSDRALSRELGYKGPNVSRLRAGIVLPSKGKMIELAHLIGMPEDEALCLLGIWEAEKKKEKQAASIYRKMLDAIQHKGVAAAGLAFILIYTMPGVAHAAEQTAHNLTSISEHCILWKIRYYI